jgi:hypothetical protein
MKRKPAPHIANLSLDEAAEWIAAGITDGVHRGNASPTTNVRNRAVVALMHWQREGAVAIPHLGRVNEADRRMRG